MPAKRKPQLTNQKQRTRKDLLRAAARLMKQGRKPSLEEIAEEALVSRATAYRYFSSAEALLLEASLDVQIPEPEALFGERPPQDSVARLERVDTALHDLVLANEATFRVMLARMLERGFADGKAHSVPARQNRRTPLIEAALEPARQQFDPAAYESLSRALALIVGPEAMVVCKDVLQLSDRETRKLKRWAIGALVEAARNAAS